MPNKAGVTALAQHRLTGGPLYRAVNQHSSMPDQAGLNALAQHRATGRPLLHHQNGMRTMIR